MTALSGGQAARAQIPDWSRFRPLSSPVSKPADFARSRLSSPAHFHYYVTMRAPTLTPRFSFLMTLIIFVVLHAIFALELYFDLMAALPHSHLPTMTDLWHVLDGSAVMSRASGTTISRAYNVLVSLVITSIALAVPLTANMYTPKLIDIFISDRVNVTVLTFFVLSAAHAIWTAQATWDQGPLRDVGGFYPRIALWVGFETMTLGWAIVIPYFLYVLRCLHPGNIISRVSAQVTNQFDRIPREPDGAFEEVQVDLEQQIQHMGNVMLRAVDRADRDVTLDSIHALQSILERYQLAKRDLPPGWYKVPDHLFIGASKEGIQLLRDQRIWVEQKCLHQLALAYNSTLTKMQDAISSISYVSRQLALHADTQNDAGTLNLGVRYINTFIREAIKRKDVHAIFDIFHQYKELANELVDRRGSVVLEISKHLTYYAELARMAGLPFIYELAAYDLENMVECAYPKKATVREEMLGLLLSLDALPGSSRIVKAKLLAGGFFRANTLNEEAARVKGHLSVLPQALVESAVRDLVETHSPVFWEVTDRQVNIDYVDEERRRQIQVLVASIEFTKSAAPAK